MRVRYPAVIVTGLAAFVLSLLWYSPLLFGDIWMRHRDASLPSPPGWATLFAPVRAIVSYVMAWLISRLSFSDWKSSARLSFFLWTAFHTVGMAGAIIWDHMPVELGAVHAGDWLMKMLFMGIILSTRYRKMLLKTVTLE